MAFATVKNGPRFVERGPVLIDRIEGDHAEYLVPMYDDEASIEGGAERIGNDVQTDDESGMEWALTRLRVPVSWLTFASDDEAWAAAVAIAHDDALLAAAQ
ncbi:MAG: hypothetical protein AB7O57_02895 [Hyphomicrobiaceae bacterium]